MNTFDPATLPDAQRLAMAYATTTSRGPLLILMEFDLRLAEIVRSIREPLLAQMRLAWWRDELAKSPEERPKGEPLLAAFGEAWRGEEPALLELVNGWEELLAEPPLPAAAPENFAIGRASAFAAAARIAGAPDCDAAVTLAAQRWALADMAAKTSDIDEKAEVVATGLELGDTPVRLPRAMRPLLVLDRLARASLAAGGAPLMQGRRNILAAMRLGLFGR
jgi:phytoene synthase